MLEAEDWLRAQRNPAQQLATTAPRAWVQDESNRSNVEREGGKEGGGRSVTSNQQMNAMRSGKGPKNKTQTGDRPATTKLTQRDQAPRPLGRVQKGRAAGGEIVVGLSCPASLLGIVAVQPSGAAWVDATSQQPSVRRPVSQKLVDSQPSAVACGDTGNGQPPLRRPGHPTPILESVAHCGKKYCTGRKKLPATASASGISQVRLILGNRPVTREIA